MSELSRVRPGRRPGSVRIRYLAAGAVVAALVVVAVPRALAASTSTPPANLAFAEVGADQVKLSFVDKSTNEDAWIVESRQTRNGTFAKVRDVRDHTSGQPGSTGRTIHLTAPRVGVLDCYRVKASALAGAAASGQICLGPAKAVTFSYVWGLPRDTTLSERHDYDAATNTHTMRVLPGDEPPVDGISPDPRTEMRWLQEYRTGQHMWEADVYVVPGTDGATIMQIFRGAPRPAGSAATAFMLNVYNEDGGTFNAYSGQRIASGVYNKWWNVKVVHHANAGMIYVYLNNALVYTRPDLGEHEHYFKNGIYHHGEGLAMAYFRDLRYRTT